MTMKEIKYLVDIDCFKTNVLPKRLLLVGIDIHSPRATFIFSPCLHNTIPWDEF